MSFIYSSVCVTVIGSYNQTDPQKNQQLGLSPDDGLLMGVLIEHMLLLGIIILTNITFHKFNEKQ